MEKVEWRRVAHESEVPEGSPRAFTVGEETILLVRHEGKVHALAPNCPHYDEKLEKGVLFGHELVCGAHCARFDVRSGKVTAAPALDDLATWPVRVEGGEILVGAKAQARFPKPTGTDSRLFLIVGAGAAGNAAAETLRREGFAGRIVMVTPEADGPYDRPNLSKDLLAGTAQPEWMPLRRAKFYQENGIELRTGMPVTRLDPVEKVATLGDGSALHFDAALLATGGTARKLAIPGASSPGCYLLRSWADARQLLDRLASAKDVVCVGAGFIGLELASSLRERGIKVTVVAPEALPLSLIIGDRVAAFVMKRHQEKGVAFTMGNQVTAVSEGPGRKRVTLTDGEVLEADLVVFGLGITPALDYLAGTGLVEAGAVPVDGTLATRVPGIFAAGDIAVAPDPLTGEGRRVEHWVVAERQGQHAARAMLGSRAPFDEVPFFWTRQAGFSLKYAGHARQFDLVQYRGSVEEGSFLAGYFYQGKLKAAASVGRRVEQLAMAEIIRRGLPLLPTQLSDEGFDLLAYARRT